MLRVDKIDNKPGTAGGLKGVILWLRLGQVDVFMPEKPNLLHNITQHFSDEKIQHVVRPVIDFTYEI